MMGARCLIFSHGEGTVVISRQDQGEQPELTRNEKILDMYLNGKSQRKIAHEMGLSAYSG